MKTIETDIKNQQGTVLVISLVFLMVLTLVAVVAMQSTVMEQKISSNTAFKTKAFENSESPRPRVSDVLDHHVFERGWPDVIVDGVNVKAVDGLTLVNLDEGVPKDLFMENETLDDGSDEDILDHTKLVKDMDYKRTVPIQVDLDGDGTNDVDKSEDLKADIHVFRNGTRALPGHSAAMISGYEGTGKALAGAGAAIFFDVRSVGSSKSNARSATSADSRIIIRN